ncbi:MAG: hypothetical protein NUV69_00850 [Candidatus Curtissbacteria bacterium]|nr:hypothetical protein [Candidatus Curtissbacteria bacterium]
MNQTREEVKMQYLTQTDGWRFERTPKWQNGQNRHSSRVLATFKQIFPLALFPSDIVIEELRVVWINKKGPWMSEIISIMATDIACANASKGLLTGEIHIKSVTGGPEIYVNNLKASSAYKIRDLVEGIALASREGLRIVKTENTEDERREILRAGQVRTGVI